jgi:hypothetical protein
MTVTNYLKATKNRMIDDLLVLKAKGTVATSNIYGEDPIGTAKYYDTGGNTTKGSVVYNVYAVPNILASTKFTLRLQGGKNSSFTTLTDLAIIELGDATQLSSALDMTTGRYVVPFINSFDETVYRYLRHNITCGGTCGTGIQYECYLSDVA